MNIKLTDEQLAINNGYYYLYKGKCKFSKERLLGSHRQLTIGELCEKLLSPLQPYMSLMLNKQLSCKALSTNPFVLFFRFKDTEHPDVVKQNTRMF